MPIVTIHTSYARYFQPSEQYDKLYVYSLDQNSDSAHWEITGDYKDSPVQTTIKHVNSGRYMLADTLVTENATAPITLTDSVDEATVFDIRYSPTQKSRSITVNNHRSVQLTSRMDTDPMQAYVINGYNSDYDYVLTVSSV